MHRKTLLASTLALMIAGSASWAMAQSTPPAPPPVAHAMTANHAHAGHGERSHGMRQHGSNHQRGGVIGDLRGLERLYMQSGRSKEMAAIYNDVLAKSQDRRVRDYAYHGLARLQSQPANVDQAIATLRKGLAESLANEAKIRAEHEQMRTHWQQRADPTPPAAK